MGWRNGSCLWRRTSTLCDDQRVLWILPSGSCSIYGQAVSRMTMVLCICQCQMAHLNCFIFHKPIKADTWFRTIFGSSFLLSLPRAQWPGVPWSSLIQFLPSGVVVDGALLVTGGYDKDYFGTDIRYFNK